MTLENRPVGKAIFHAAGLGTRFLPATKELLPIIDKPLVQCAVEEAVVAGIAIDNGTVGNCTKNPLIIQTAP